VSTVQFADHLPACLAEDPFLQRFLQIFDAVANTVEMQISGMEHTIDVSVAPDRMVRWLGGWLDINDIDPSTPIERQREWVHEMGRLFWWRGTKSGVEGMLRLATGEDVAVLDTGGVYRQGEAPAVHPRHVRVLVNSVGWTTEEYLLTLLRRELPAEVTFELRVGGRQVWPRAAETR
jgi:phage tail-like protein